MYTLATSFEQVPARKKTTPTKCQMIGISCWHLAEKVLWNVFVTSEKRVTAHVKIHIFFSYKFREWLEKKEMWSIEEKDCNYDERTECVEPEKKIIIRNSFIIHWKLCAAQHLRERKRFWMCGYKHITSNYPVESPWFQSKKATNKCWTYERRWWWSV